MTIYHSRGIESGMTKPYLNTLHKLVRQVIESVIVESKEKIKIVFIGGAEAEVSL